MDCLHFCDNPWFSISSWRNIDILNNRNQEALMHQEQNSEL